MLSQKETTRVTSGFVEVLLATYNGERYLREQIDSVLGQTYAHLKILARDDGSTDGTVAILEEYAARFPARVVLLPTGAPSGGAKWNFIRLTSAATAPYVAFCDQDDVWLPGKIALEMQAMRGLEEQFGPAYPLLVFTDLKVVDQDLRELHASLWKHHGTDPRRVRRLGSSLAQNVVTGCSCLLNAPLAALAATMPATAYMHDWWVALLACIFGHSAWLSETTVLYRQHDSNVLGAPREARRTGVPRWRYHDGRRQHWEASERQAEGLLEVFGDRLPPRALRVVRDYVRCEQSPHRLTRIWTLVRRRFFASGWRYNVGVLWYLWDMDFAKRESATRRAACE